jgi:hypothetical protein
MRKKRYRSFESGRKFVRKLKLKNINEYQKWFRKNKPDNLPSKPERTYKDEGWDGYGDWLGTGRIADKNKIWMSFKAAKKFTHKLKLRDTSEWKEYCKSGNKPIDIPSTPNQVYKNDGWIDWPHWLGNGNLSNTHRDYFSYEQCSKLIQKNNISTRQQLTDFRKSYKNLEKIPGHPWDVYKKQGTWISWGDFTGTNKVANQHKKFRSFSSARKFVRSLKLKTQGDWQQYSRTKKRPTDIPSLPASVYKKEWKGWGDFLGTGTIANQNKEYLSAKEAKPVLQKLFKKYDIKNGRSWTRFAKTHKILLAELHIPSDVLKVYSKENVKGKLKNG